MINVTFTTWPERDKFVPTMLASIAKQTRRPDRVVMWLSEAEYPGRVIPAHLKKCVSDGLITDVEFTKKNIYAHKRWEIVKKYPGDYNISVDDDIIYDKNYVDDLYKTAQKYPNCAITWTTRRNEFYNKCRTDILEFSKTEPLKNQFLSGVSCFPPNVFPMKSFDYSETRDKYIRSDDAWIRAWLIKEGIPVMGCHNAKDVSWRGIKGTEDSGNWKINKQMLPNGCLKLVANFANSLSLIGATKEAKKLWPKFDIEGCITVNKPQIDTNGVSICITAFNASKYIKECLDSVANQTYFKTHTNYEIIVGIDGCKDTFDTVQKLMGSYKNIRVYMMTSNQGTYITSNTIMSIARYDNLIRFDSDDVMCPNMVDVIMSKKGSSDVYQFRFNNFGDVTNNIKKLAEGVFCVSKSTFMRFGGFRPWRCSGDSEFHLRAKRFVRYDSTNEELFNRRGHSDSLTRKKGDTMVVGGVGSLRKRYQDYYRYESTILRKKEDSYINMVTNDFYEVTPFTECRKLKPKFTLVDTLENDQKSNIANSATSSDKKKDPFKLFGMTLVYNESKMIPYIMPYYERMGFDKLVIYDNESTDNTVELLKKYPFVEVRSFSTGGKKNNRVQSQLKSDAIKEFSKYTNAWMYIADFDEVVYRNGDFKKYLEKMDKEGYTYMNQQMFEIFSDKFPDISDNRLVHTKVAHGNMWCTSQGCKLTLFKVSGMTKLTYSPGAHQASAIVPYTPKSLNWNGIYSFHIKYIDYEYCKEHTRLAAGHRSSEDVSKGYGVQYERYKTENAFKHMWDNRSSQKVSIEKYLNGELKQSGTQPRFTFSPAKITETVVVPLNKPTQNIVSSVSKVSKLPSPTIPCKTAPIVTSPSEVCQFIVNCGTSNAGQDYITRGDVVLMDCKKDNMAKAYTKLIELIDSGRYKWILFHTNNIRPVHVERFKDRLDSIVGSESNIGLYSPSVIKSDPTNLNARKTQNGMRSVHEITGHCVLINTEAFAGKISPDFTKCETGAGFIRHMCVVATKNKYAVTVDDGIYHCLGTVEEPSLAVIQRHRFEYMRRNDVDVKVFKFPAVQLKIKF